MLYSKSCPISTLLIILTFCAIVQTSQALSMIDSLNQDARSEWHITELSANKINSPSIINQPDAPTYYDRNAQLYKKSGSKFDESNSRPINSNENSSIDTLIKSMRAGTKQDDMMSIIPSHNDEATIQRKSTSEEVASAKLMRAISDRRRRATNRSGPPKLKSRMRVSRRRIRHNVKPKRRA